MAVAMRYTPTSPCLGCGEHLDGETAFCPACGTRQAQERPMATARGETERLARSTNAWMLTGLAAGALMLLAVALVTGVFR